MEKDRLLEILKNEPNDRDAIGMILSNYTDFTTSEGGMVSIKQFKIVAGCLIEWWEGKEKLTRKANELLPPVINWVATKDKQPPTEVEIDVYSQNNIRSIKLLLANGKLDAVWFPYWRKAPEPPCL